VFVGPGVFDRRLLHQAGRGSVLLAALLALSCGGGGGGGSDALPCTPLSFDRALSSLAVGDVYLDQASGTCSTIGISVLVDGVMNIWTVGFDLNFPAALLSYDSYTLGPLMLKGSPTFQPVVLLNQTAGSLHVSVSRFGTDPSVNANGSEALITFRFSRISAGSAGLDFDVSASSPITESIMDEHGTAQPATFAPGHGGMVIVP
jgi:hypothetical protein